MAPAGPPDVVVVGAGPGGVAAAITLARGGASVTLIDRATFPRDKICGDGLTTAALRELEALGWYPGAVDDLAEVHEIVVRSPSGREILLPLPRGQGTFAAVCPRRVLDASLVELARDAGVTVSTGHRVTAATEDATGVRLELDGGSREIRTPWGVAADGMWSPLRRYLGLASVGYRGEWHAFRQYYRGVTGSAAERLHVAFEADILPGYFWAFPLPGNRANIGFGIVRDGGKVGRVQEMAHLWRELTRRPHLRDLLGPGAEPDGPHRAWPIPARIDTISTHSERVLFVGDAVAACDTLTGEGIGQALLTGRLAGEALLGATGQELPGELYHRSVRSHLLADHRMSVLLTRALRHRKGARAAVRVAGATPWTRRNFARWLFEDYPRGIAITPHRWRRGLMSGPGAFRSGPAE